uniref:Uncharacterized protein n=1 Tax=Oryza nivara TaxID=4536 RepID=A0A0E0JAC2_ORYNI
MGALPPSPVVKPDIDVVIVDGTSAQSVGCQETCRALCLPPLCPLSPYPARSPIDDQNTYEFCSVFLVHTAMRKC